MGRCTVKPPIISSSSSLCLLSMIFSSWWLLFLALVLASVAEGINVTELTIATDLELFPSSNQFVIAQGTSSFAGRGYVDLSDLKFLVSMSGSHFPRNPPPEGNSNSTSISNSSTTSENGMIPSSETMLDVVWVHIPSRCFRRRVDPGHEIVIVKTEDCDWSKSLGVGYSDNSSTSGDNVPGNSDHMVWYCCSKQAEAAGACTSEQNGRLIVNPKLLKGGTRNVTVRGEGGGNDEKVNPTVTFNVTDPFLAVHDAGTYVLLLANCDVENGREVLVNGKIKLVSYSSDYEKFYYENVPFYLIMTVLYILLGVWYGCLMIRNKDSRIRLEEWIILTIALGFLDVFLRLIKNMGLEEGMHKSGDDGDANDANWTEIVAMIVALVGGVKHASSRYLLLMLSMGWGVVFASIDCIPSFLSATLALVYCVVSTCFIFLLYTTDISADFMRLVFTILVAIELIFMVWIPAALFSTMRYLKKSNQVRKLGRYRSLLWILCFAIFLTVALLALVMVDFYLDNGQEVTLLNIQQGNELNFFIILLCVALLWSPNPMAREFAYVTELSTTDDDSMYENDEFRNEHGVGPLGMDERDGYLADLELTENHGKLRNGSSMADTEEALRPGTVREVL